MSPPRLALSVVVPAFDEGACIGASLRAIAAWLEQRAPAPGAAAAGAEIIVVDDGSRDDTAAAAREAARALPLPVRVLRSPRNRGKGAALRAGFAVSRGERVLFTDADLSTPIATGDALLEALEAGADLAIGSRKRAGARVEVHQPWWRESLGKVFTALVRLGIAPVSDATCGFKAFRGDAGRALFARARLDDWSFDAEILFLAVRDGLRIAELPVVWRDQPGTKVRIARDVALSLAGLARIRLNALLGRYAQPAPPRETPESWANEAALRA